MLGAIIIIAVLLVALPMAFLMAGAVIAVILGSALNADAAQRHEGSELLDLS